MNIFKFFKKTKDANQSKQLKDPVCGMQVSDTIILEHKGRPYGFCSDHCKQQFEKNPEGYSVK